MEDFLREAACMKEFDHQNVMRLLGKSDHALSLLEHKNYKKVTYSNMDFTILPNTVTGGRSHDPIGSQLSPAFYRSD